MSSNAAVDLALHAATLHAARMVESSRHAAEAARVRRHSFGLGLLRLLVFAVGAFLSVRAAVGDGPATLALAAWIAFAAVVSVHRRVRDRGERAAWRAQLARESAARIVGGRGPGTLAALPESPASPLDAAAPVYRPDEPESPLSPWAIADLGIDGSDASLVTLLDTTQTLFGARRLRRMLHSPLGGVDAIRARQEAVAYWAREREHRDALYLAMRRGRNAPLTRLPAFLATPRMLHGRFVPLLALACTVAQVGALATLRIWPEAVPVLLAGVATSFALHLALRTRIALLRDGYRELEPMVRVAREAGPALDAAADPISKAAHAVLAHHAHESSRIAAALRGLHVQDTGALYPVFELATSIELLSLCVLESRVKRSGAGWDRVAAALGDTEALAALGLDADERSGHVTPAIETGAPAIDIEAGVHPLLDPRRAVPNDLRLGQDVRVLLVTGSNMAGKSTFLRMVATNVVLAQIGAVVRARSMRLVPLDVQAHIHVRDSLADGKSTFLVEVERVHTILDRADASPAVLGILDELFRGTNSIERVAAGRAIARHLATTGALFLIATHDPELARLAEEGVPGVAAAHFADAIAEGRMVFPYRLEHGQARTRNAIRLLEITGYPTAVTEGARREAGARGLDGPAGE